MVKLGHGGGLGRRKRRKVLKSKKVTAAVQKKADAVQAYWKDIAPVFGDQPPRRAAPRSGAPGDYRDSIVQQDMSGSDGARIRIKATDFKAKWIEFGNAHMPTYAPLAKTKARFRK